MDCETSTTAVDGTTFVSVIVENPHDEPAAFRVANELDGPVLPPRRHGYPEEGWDEDGYEGVLDSGEHKSLGYAVPAPPVDPPATIVRSDPAEASETQRSVTDTARSFRDPRPPRSVLTPPVPDRFGSRLDGDAP